jgi:formamidopyrimidine-DNA glycosylase
MRQPGGTTQAKTSMPELPEVEITRRTLAPKLIGSRVVSARLGKPLRWPLGCALQSLSGQTVQHLTRRGKYIWVQLDHGGLLLHLGMSGSLAWLESAHAQDPAGPHDHFDVLTTQGLLRLTDPRRFGAVVWSASLTVDPAAKLLAKLGVEPLGEAFNGELLFKAFERRHVAVKTALLGGQIVVGAGNIYACEALFTARIHPATPCHALNLPRCHLLAQAIQQTLRQALELGGTTLRDFRDVHGSVGRFQTQSRVYGHAGKPCVSCQTPIERWVQAQRSSFFCPKCQAF